MSFNSEARLLALLLLTSGCSLGRFEHDACTRDDQ